MTQSLFKCLFKKSKYNFKRLGGGKWVTILDLKGLKESNSQIHSYNTVLDTVFDKPDIKDIFEPTR